MSRKERMYNCFGYAVGRKKWLIMQSWREYADGILDYEEAIVYGIQEIQERFGYKVVMPEDMELGKEYVAYRFADDDFHFMLRNKSGIWRHKRGGSAAVTTTEEHALYSDTWDDRYDSDVVLFEKGTY